MLVLSVSKAHTGDSSRLTNNSYGQYIEKWWLLKVAVAWSRGVVVCATYTLSRILAWTLNITSTFTLRHWHAQTGC